MLACVIHRAHEVSLDPRPEPKPGPGEVVVRFGAGGICGSDLHYYQEGRVGDFELREPLVLGHEVAGVVAQAGAGVTTLRVGDRVAVNPARPCRQCRFCRAGRENLCPETRFFGSAARFPHVQGAFAERFLAHETQCVPVAEDVPLSVAAFAEPLAVALHAVRRAGELLGRRVLVTGAGPIGSLVVAAARLAGAAEIVATDRFDAPLTVARKLGADRVVNVAAPNDAASFSSRGQESPYDFAIEASGALPALTTCLESVASGGRVVALGLTSAPQATFRPHPVVTREIELVGSFRFHEEFAQAVDLLQKRRLDPTPLLTAQVPFRDAPEAFRLATDRARSIKVSLVAEA